MAFENFPEVWAALGRLYDSIVEMQKQQARTDAHLDELGSKVNSLASSVEGLASSVENLTERVDRVVSTVATLAGTVGQMASIVDSHERRLDRLEGQ